MQSKPRKTHSGHVRVRFLVSAQLPQCKTYSCYALHRRALRFTGVVYFGFKTATSKPVAKRAE